MSKLSGSIGVVTGASGFIGRAVLQQLPPEVTVFATYRADTDFPQWAAGLNADVRLVQIDLAREVLAAKVPVKLDWALCLAARVATASSRDDPVDELVQVAGPAVNSVAGLRADRVVYISTGSVYETLEGELSPQRKLEPRLPYAVGKLAGEMLVKSYCETEPWVARFFGAYGPGEPAFKITRRLVESFVAGTREFKLTGDGGNRLDPMHISDAAAMILTLCVSDRPPTTVDLCQGESATMQEYARLIYEVAHPSPHEEPLHLEFVGEARDEMRGTSDSAAADEITGNDRRSLREGLGAYATWCRQEGLG